MCSSAPPVVVKRSVNGWDSTSSASPAKSTATSRRRSARLSKPCIRPVASRYCSPGRCRCPARQVNPRTGTDAIAGAPASSWTGQITSAPVVFHRAVHRRAHPGPVSRCPAASASTAHGVTRSSSVQVCDQTGRDPSPVSSWCRVMYSISGLLPCDNIRGVAQRLQGKPGRANLLRH